MNHYNASHRSVVLLIKDIFTTPKEMLWLQDIGWMSELYTIQ